MKLDLRLRMVASHIRVKKPLVDIGTDHAYLPVYLVLNDIIPSAIASDIKVGPLNNAKKTIEQNEVGDKVEAVLSDGLQNIPHDCTDFVLAGMGGNLISDILAAAPWVKQKGNHFVLQPQTHAADLREYLYSEGFEILCEDVVKMGRHLYIAFEVEYTGEIKEHSMADYYVGKLKESTSIYKNEYLDYEASRLETQLKATRNEKLQPLIDAIKGARS